MEFKSDVLGLALLGSISAFSIWSAANPSVFTISQFTTEKSKQNARLGMNIGLGLCGALSAGLYLAYGKKGAMPAALTGATGVGLYALYEHMLSTSHISNPDNKTMPQQFEAMQGRGGGGGGGGGGGQIDNRGIKYPTKTDPDGTNGGGGNPGGGGGGGGPQGLPGGAGVSEPIQGGYGDDNFYMSKAQVQQSGWPECSQCLTHGRTLKDCSLMGACRGPWSDGATPYDVKQKQLKLSGFYYDNEGYADDGQEEDQEQAKQIMQMLMDNIPEGTTITPGQRGLPGGGGGAGGSIFPGGGGGGGGGGRGPGSGQGGAGGSNLGIPSRGSYAPGGTHQGVSRGSIDSLSTGNFPQRGYSLEDYDFVYG